MKYTSKLGLNLMDGVDKLSPKAINENTEKIGKELDYHAQGYQLRATEGGDPLYTEVATVDLSAKAEGDIIQLVEGGKLVDFWVAQKNYGSALDGAGKTLLVRCLPTAESWVNTSVTTTFHNWLDGGYREGLGAAVKKAIETTTVQLNTFSDYGAGTTTAARGVFALSGTELGLGDRTALGSLLPTAAAIKAKLLAANKYVWLRSTTTLPLVSSSGETYDGLAVCYTYINNGTIVMGSFYSTSITSGEVRTAHGLPAFAVPNDFSYTLYTNGTNYYDEQAYGTPRTAVFPYGSDDPLATLGELNLLTGSYVGTGVFCTMDSFTETLDKTNVTVIQFPVKPKLWGIYAKKYQPSGITSTGLQLLSGVMFPWLEEELAWRYAVDNYGSSTYVYVECTADNRAVLAATDVAAQMNEADCEYFWWALY